MKYLIMDVNSNDEWAEEPAAFVLALTDDAIGSLEDYCSEIAEVSHRDFLQADFSWRNGGIWAAYGDWVDEVGASDDETDWRDNTCFFWKGEVPELEEFEGVSSEMVAVDQYGNICFKFYGKWSNVEYYTDEISLESILDEIQKETQND